MLTRDDALKLLHAQAPEPHMLAHALDSEAVMRALALALDKPDDADLWAMVGLLHDVDYPCTKETPNRHGVEACALIGEGLPAEALRAITAHNSECTGCDPLEPMDYALRCAESVTGLVKAAALVRPTGFEGMKAKSLKKKMKDKSFAASVSRERIMECERLGLELGPFLELAIAAMAAQAAETA